MIRRALPFLTGAALAAALVLTGVAIYQTLRLMQLRPEGIRTQATVLIVDLRAPDSATAFPQGEVRLFISDPDTGTFTISLDHPPATLTELWFGGQVEVAVVPGDAPVVAFWPTIPEHRHRTTLIFLGVTLALAAIFGLARRFLKA